MLDDSTVVGEGCFFGCVVCTNVFCFAINSDLCFEPLPFLGHSSIPTGVCRIKFSFLCWNIWKMEVCVGRQHGLLGFHRRREKNAIKE